jgi:hypothetical protein
MYQFTYLPWAVFTSTGDQTCLTLHLLRWYLCCLVLPFWKNLSLRFWHYKQRIGFERLIFIGSPNVDLSLVLQIFKLAILIGAVFFQIQEPSSLVQRQGPIPCALLHFLKVENFIGIEFSNKFKLKIVKVKKIFQHIKIHNLPINFSLVLTFQKSSSLPMLCNSLIFKITNSSM